MPGAFLHPFAKPSREHFPSIVRGKGALVWDDEDNEMIDAMASLWYCNIGHGRGDMADAIAAQVRTIEAYSCFDPFSNEPADRLADKIASLTNVADARIFFTNSGSEAIDTAMKLARLTHVRRGRPERRLIISRTRGYHGTNYGGTSAQGLPLNKEGYGTLLGDVIQVPSDDIEALSVLMADRSDEIAAVLTEPVQGAAGVFPPPDGYLEEARRLCDQHGALLIFDEVITGFGRLGTWFASERFGVVPDLATFAKGVTSGYVPLGGVVLGRTVSAALEADPDFVLRHGYTYSGHHTACVAALKNIEVIEQHKLLKAAAGLGYRLARGLRAIADDGGVAEVRGDGAVWAVGMRPDQDAMQVRDTMLAHGVITRAIGTDSITFCPPFVTTDEQIDTVIDVLATAVTS